MDLSSISEQDLAAFGPEGLAYIKWQAEWSQTARPNQIIPKVHPDTGELWSECGVQAGRGFGKTRVGAEWLGREVYEDPSGFPSAVICPTFSDVKFTAFEGESGLLRVVPPDLVVSYNKSDLTIEMRNIAGGTALIRGFSSEKPERLRGPQNTRGWCFVAGTQVRMADGSEKAIETVRAGESVMTRFGARRVQTSGRSANPSRRVRLEFGATSLTCTEDHPILTTRGWVGAGALGEGDEIWSVSGTLEHRGGSGRMATTATGDLGSCSTGASTRIISGLFQRVWLSTTRTTTQPTTILPIWNSWHAATTPGITSRASSGRTSARQRRPLASRRSWLRYLLSVSCAFSAARLTSTRLSALRVVSAAPDAWISTDGHGSVARFGSARTAETDSTRCDQSRNSAPRRATRRTRLSGRPSTARRYLVCSAAQSSRPSETTPGSAPGLVLSKVPIRRLVRLRERAPVYDLTVEDVHEFIANGVVVHNCDEIAAWQNAEDTWDMYQFGLRLGEHPQTLWTSTPKPKELVRKLIAPMSGRFIIRGSTYENKANLPSGFFKQIEQYEGTTLGRQEIAGELIDPEESGIVKRSHFRLWSHSKPLPAFDMIIVSLDTAFTEKTLDRKSHNPDATACTVWGIFQYEKRGNIMLLDCWDEHLGLPELIRRCRREMAARYGDDSGVMIKPQFGPATSDTAGRRPDILLIEDKGSGISLRQMLEQEGIIAYPYNPGRADKLTRLHIVSPVFARRLVWLPESSNPLRRGMPVNWCDTMLAQLCSFTGTGSIKHDDYVDSVSQCLRLCMDKGFLSAARPAHEERRKDEEETVRRHARGPRVNPYAS